MGEDAAPVDVGNQNHRAIDGLGKAHVGDVAGAQVDFGRRAGAFDQYRVVSRGQPPPRLQHRLHRTRLVFLVIAGIEVGGDPAVDHHLRLLVGSRLQQHRIEVGMRLQAAGQRLQRLRPADLAAVDGDRRVERHVLRLERRDGDAVALENPAQRGDQRRFAGIGSSALHHQGRTGNGGGLSSGHGNDDVKKVRNYGTIAPA